MKRNQQTVTLPQKSLHNLLDVIRDFERFQDEIEDFLLFQNPEFLKKMRQAQREHREGKTIRWEELRKKYVQAGTRKKL